MNWRDQVAEILAAALGSAPDEEKAEIQALLEQVQGGGGQEEPEEEAGPPVSMPMQGSRFGRPRMGQ